MRDEPPASDPDANPLAGDSPPAWHRLIDSLSPPAILVVIRRWMSAALAREHAAEDVWQETLLHAWQDRARLEWRGRAAFRRWLLQIAWHRIHDLADHGAAAKRSGDATARSPADSLTGGGSDYAGPVASTTPSRAASDRELADLMEAGLSAVREDWREIVRLRLFEDLAMEEIAMRLGVGIEGVRYRFRKGLEAYRTRLRQLRVMSSALLARDSRTEGPSDSSSRSDG